MSWFEVFDFLKSNLDTDAPQLQGALGGNFYFDKI